MGKSVVAVYCGGRGSGKTLSMTAAGVIAMCRGRKVWSNYPIYCDYKDPDGVLHHYESTIIDVQDLLEMQRRDEIRDGFVMLDEWNLFMNARRSGAIANIVFSGVVQLIRKRKLSFYITTQDFHTLDRNIRWQCDVTVGCFDLSFRYPNLKEGQIISQRITDWTGVYTGRMLSDKANAMELQRNSRVRLFVKAPKFFGCYPTEFEFDVLAALTAKYRMNDLAGNDNGGFDVSVLSELREELVYSQVERLTTDQLQEKLEERGIQGDLKGRLGKKLKAAGFRYKQLRSGNFYDVGEIS